MKLRWIALGLWVFSASFAASPARAGEGDQAAIEAVVDLLKERGVIEPGEAQRIIALNRTHEEKRSWTERISFFGDFRGRYEGFWFDEDPLGAEKDNRHRLRYRLRFGAKAEINDFFDFKFRIATGPDDSASRNQTLGADDDDGDAGVDFDPDDVMIDQAYVTFHPFVKHGAPFGAKKLDLSFGKMSNLFRSKVGKDMVFWDGDMTPEGVAGRYLVDPCEGFSLTLNGGYFIVDENSSKADPHLIASQLRMAAAAGDALWFGTNVSYYGFRSVDGSFLTRGTAKGNIPGGLTDDDGVDIGDVRAWVRFTGMEGFPILLYGNALKNFSAEDTTGYNAGKDDMAWSVGLELGDKKQYGQLGVGFFSIDANAVPANKFIDSDLFDGRTNGEGWVVYGARQVLRNTDLKFTLFVGQPKDDEITWIDAVEDSERIRLQTDLVVKF